MLTVFLDNDGFLLLSSLTVWQSSGDWASGVDYGFYDSEGAFDAEGGGVAAEAVDDYAVIANADTLVPMGSLLCQEDTHKTDNNQ
ncbi:Hypp7207 [Branchiostoma lanceolatum]|uniref:Hypp7207 protein n=1 Tax=Branchiostoma lanceolatum TaxID=7740 RepID=A0A8K0ECY8_BRALA|nr:Hypp7207 [Branchiostoma lanceolatum]